MCVCVCVCVCVSGCAGDLRTVFRVSGVRKSEDQGLIINNIMLLRKSEDQGLMRTRVHTHTHTHTCTTFLPSPAPSSPPSLLALSACHSYLAAMDDFDYVPVVQRPCAL